MVWLIPYDKLYHPFGVGIPCNTYAIIISPLWGYSEIAVKIMLLSSTPQKY